jgi:hypothetical protein
MGKLGEEGSSIREQECKATVGTATEDSTCDTQSLATQSYAARLSIREEQEHTTAISSTAAEDSTRATQSCAA